MPFPFGFQPDGGQAYDLSDSVLAGHSGSLPMDAAEIKYLQRNGGDIQGLGVGIEAYAFNCFYTGEGYDSRLRGLRAAYQAQPKGLLTHPALGPIRAHCLGIPDFTVDYLREYESVNFRIIFKRDSTDSTLQVSAQPSVSSRAAALTNTLRNAAPVINAVASAATQIALLPTTINVIATSINGAFAGLVNFASIFANSAVKAATLGQVDLTLEVQRDAVFSQCELMTTALRQAGLPDAAIYPALSATRTIYASTLELDTLVRTQSPQVTTVVVQGRTPIVVLAAQYYGGPAATGKIDEIRINNRIGSFGALPGTTLRLVGTTVTQSTSP